MAQPALPLPQTAAVDILGIQIDALSIDAAIDWVTDRARPGQPSTRVVKIYLEHLDRAGRDAGFRELLNSAGLRLADGVACNWAAAYLHGGKRTTRRLIQTLSHIALAPDRLRYPLPDRVGGINFTWPLLEAAARQGLRVFLIGSPVSHSILHTAETLTAAIPGLRIVGTHEGRDHTLPSGQVSEFWLRRVASEVSAARPDIVLVGMGPGLQEEVCRVLADMASHGVFVGEGGSFDYAAFGGPYSRAPRWVQRSGLERFWRLAQDFSPGRIRRQFAAPRYISYVWRNR
jgi:N-acetylglucosaminyldiphosphoundecaprenol N-acetyl-beta-D-mannosaminyltransferase